MRKKRARTKARKARIETSAAREALEGKTHLSISEAAKFLGVSRPTLYARIEQGELTPLRVSTRTIRTTIARIEADLRAAKEKYDKWTALRRESREYAREQARKHREILSQVEAELGLPKSLRRYAKKAQEEE